MKENIFINQKIENFDEYKIFIDLLIKKRKIDKLKLQPNYFDITNNYWIIDKYIAKHGQVNHDLVPNTLSAYKEAIKSNYAITISIQMLDDDSIVCFSYKNLSRVIPDISGYLNKLTLEDIKKIPLNDKNETIPTLEEALNFIANKTEIIIDVHNDGMVGKFEDKVLNILQKYIEKYNCYNRVAIMSINPYTLQYFYQNNPYITRILRTGNFTDKYYGSIPTKKLKKLKLYNITHADFICISHELLPSPIVENKDPVGILAYDVVNQNQYLTIAPYSDNIVFSKFEPKI